MISDQQSICVYHNGNSRIIQHYRDKFPHLIFGGNWAEAADVQAQGYLWEVCFTDATTENMIDAIKRGIFVLRHISAYQDDIDNLLPECQLFDYDHWLNYVVSNNLCFASQVVSDISVTDTVKEKHTVAVVTTGRTANAHFRRIIGTRNQESFEANPDQNIISQRLLESNSAVFLWRIDQWECLTSTWIGQQSAFIHQLRNEADAVFASVPDIDTKWIDTDWYNHCRAALSHAMFYQYVCQRPITQTTTEYIVSNFQTPHQKLKYDKSALINNYQQSKQYYAQSDIRKNLELLYNRVVGHFKPWTLD